jgi:hypothetical protein
MHQPLHYIKVSWKVSLYLLGKIYYLNKSWKNLVKLLAASKKAQVQY